MRREEGQFYVKRRHTGDVLSVYMRVEQTPMLILSGVPGNQIAALRQARMVGKVMDLTPPSNVLVDTAYVATWTRIKYSEIPRHLYNILLEA